MNVDILFLGTREDFVCPNMKTSRNICSAVFFLGCGGENIIVDPGGPGYAGKVLEKLSEKGINPEDVGIVVNTHSHLDHIYNNYLFPNAKIYCGSSIWVPGMPNRVEMYKDIEEAPIPFVKLIKTPGHMEKHISVFFEKDGESWVIAGDAVREDIIESGKLTPYIPDRKKYLKSLKKIFNTADVIIPGHGPIIKGEKIQELNKKIKKLKIER
jgi:glyoxylase-like metal-dependent hydrolase (beta-lactamase superfamily II)